MVAAGVFLAGVRMLILLVLLGRFGDSVVGSFGYAQNVYGIVAVLCAGHGIAVMAALAGSSPAGSNPARARLLPILTTAWASTALLVLLALLFGATSVLVLPVHVPIFAAAYLAATTSAVFLPLAQSFTGLQQVRGHEYRSLLHTVEGFVISVGLGGAGVLLASDAVFAVTAIGLGCFFGDLWSTARRYMSVRGEVRGLPTAALRVFLSAPKTALARVPRTAAGGYDGLILMTSFIVVSQVAVSHGAATGAATVTLIAAVRTIVVPLKSFGIVGGRLIRSQTSDPMTTARLFWLLVRVGAIAIAPLGLVCLIVPAAPIALLQLESTSDVEFAVRLVGGQLLLEPLTGLGAAMLKVIVKPTALLLPLATSLLGWALPATLALNALSDLTVAGIWTILLIGRIGFAAFLIRAARPGRLLPPQFTA